MPRESELDIVIGVHESSDRYPLFSQDAELEVNPYHPFLVGGFSG